MTHPILHDIDAFLRRTNLSETYFGRQAANDWKLISQLRKGRRLCRARRADAGSGSGLNSTTAGTNAVVAGSAGKGAGP